MANSFISAIKDIKNLLFIIFFLNLISHCSSTSCNVNIPVSIDPITDTGNPIVLSNLGHSGVNTSCWYKFTAPSNDYSYQIEFQRFNLQDKECFDKNQTGCCDYLKIGTGTELNQNTLTTLCGSLKIKDSIVVNSDSMWFLYKEDETEESESFTIKITPIRTSFRAQSGLIESPSTTKFDSLNNLTMTYKIYTSPDRLTFLRFERLNLENFNDTCFDYLKIGKFSENSTNITVYSEPAYIICQDNQKEIAFKSNQTYLKFITDLNTQSSFKIFYDTIKYLYTDSTGVIESSNKPVNITYKIRAPPNKRIEIMIQNFEFNNCLAEKTDDLTSSPNQACSMYNDYLLFVNQRGNIQRDFYNDIKKLPSNDHSHHWIFCACNKPAKTYVSLTNELDVRLNLNKYRKENKNQFRILYRFVSAELNVNNQLRIVQDRTSIGFIDGFLLRAKVPVNNHIRLYGRSSKCKFPKYSLVSKQLMFKNETFYDKPTLKKLTLNGEEFNKTCTYLIDLGEPKLDSTSGQNHPKFWEFNWYLKFETPFELYDFELNFMVINNLIAYDKKPNVVKLPAQTGFDEDKYDELGFTFKTSSSRRKYTLNFEKKLPLQVENSNKNTPYVKINDENGQEILATTSAINGIQNSIKLNDTYSVVKVQRYGNLEINFGYTTNNITGDCSFDESFCSFTTDPFALNQTLVDPSDQFIVKHLPKYATLDRNDINAVSKAKDFYIAISRQSFLNPISDENEFKLYSPLIKAQKKDEQGSYDGVIYSLSFSYMIPSSSSKSNRIELFISRNRSDSKLPITKNTLKSEILKTFDSESSLDDNVKHVKDHNQCPSVTYSSILSNSPISSITGSSSSSSSASLAIHKNDDKFNQWYRANNIEIFSCDDFRFGFKLNLADDQDANKTIPLKASSIIGIDDVEIDRIGVAVSCKQNNCGDNGKCFQYDKDNTPVCCCNPGYQGEKCEIKINACDFMSKNLREESMLDAKLDTDVCKNGGQCIDLDNEFNYKCMCQPGFTGRNCETEINECASNPCKNDGKCIDMIGSFMCVCKNGFSGKTCKQKDPDCKNKCSSEGTAECYNDRQETICKCKPDYTGEDCSQKLFINRCKSNPCVGDSVCKHSVDDFKCICPISRTGKFCEIEIDYCHSHLDLCRNGSVCIFANKDGSKFKCSCQAGFTGKHCDIPVNDCDSNPCLQGKCIDLHLGYRCECEKGVIGYNCDMKPSDPCYKNRCEFGSTCIPDGKSNYTCICGQNHYGDYCEIQKCNYEKHFNEVCDRNGTINVISYEDRCKCICKSGYNGDRCEKKQDICEIRNIFDLENECLNGGTCISTSNNEVSCKCRPGYTGDRCQTIIDHCKSNPCKYGSCKNMDEGYRCVCTRGWEGKNCNEKVVSCKIEDQCIVENTDEVLFSQGTCVCMCKRGFTGDKCEVNIDDCSPNRCKNNGTCIDLVASFECKCPIEYTGAQCETKSKSCDNSPCKNGKCDEIAGKVICHCDRGYTGELCDKKIDKCDPNPCENEGVCHNLVDDYFCACLPEFGNTKNCSQRLIDPCKSSPCFNNGTCNPIPMKIKDLTVYTSFTCQCPKNFKGELCEMPTDPCSSNPCGNRGKCTLSKNENGYTCNCFPAFTGPICETFYDQCDNNICKNGGTCIPTPEGPECKCPYEYSGKHCENQLDPCGLLKCINGGECHLKNNVPYCKCPNHRYIGTRCEIDLTKESGLILKRKISGLMSEALHFPTECEVLGNNVGTLDYVFVILIILGILVLIIALVYLYVHLRIKKTKSYYNQVSQDNEVLDEINEVNNRYT